MNIEFVNAGRRSQRSIPSGGALSDSIPSGGAPSEGAADRPVTSVLALIRLPWILVDGGLRVLRANASADALLAAGTLLRRGEAGLVACDPASDRALARGVANVCRGPCERGEGDGTPAHVVPIVDARNARTVFAMLAPIEGVALGAGTEPGARRAVLLVLFGGGDRTVASIEPLALAFGLTDAEARVCAALLAGRSASEIARERGVALSTVRTHIKSLLHKTGTRSQAKLVAMLAPALVVGPSLPA